MIDKRGTPGDWTDGVMEPYQGDDCPRPAFHESVPARASQVLGPDGNPVMIPVPRHAVGFDLTKRKDSN